MDPPGLEIAPLLSATRNAYFRLRSFEIVGIDELGSVVTHHLVGIEPTTALQLGLTRRKLPSWSVVRIKSGDVSNRRLRSSTSRLSAAVLSRMSADMFMNALASTPISPLAEAGTTIGSLRANDSTALVICASGFVIERAMITANMNATRTAPSAVIALASRIVVAPAMTAE